MSTAYFSHPDCLEHVTPSGHPERVDRLKAIEQVLDLPDFSDLDRREAPFADRAAIAAVHPDAHIAMVEAAAPETGHRSIDADTHVSPGSVAAAYRAAGGNVAAVDAVLSGEVSNAFVGTRPPGHHAETATAMGFCFFGNVVIGARHALKNPQINKVAIVDFDVHHGNGTQDLVWDDENILFVSTHQMPLFPGTGARGERGGHGNVTNIPLDAHTNGTGYKRLFDREALPALDAFAPDLILISAGFDAHTADPLANIDLVAQDFADITKQIYDLADHHAAGRVVSTLEGGYDLNGLASSVAAHIQVLMERGE